MKLGDLLYVLREDILHDKTDLVPDSPQSDQLWSDRTLILYIDEAQRRMCREGLILRDGTTKDICTFWMKALQREYALHPSILAVVSAKCGPNPNLTNPINHPDHADLTRAGHASFNEFFVPNPYFFDPSSLSYQKPGKVVAFDTDEFLLPNNNGEFSVMNMRLYPTPSADFVQPVHMRVIRLPQNHLTRENLDAYPEIPEEHHVDMLDWAAYLALRKVDHDAGDPARAAEFKQSFEVHVAEAKKIAMRKLFATLQMGFGRNGFSWEQN
jgi:hypothetical protein